MQVILTIWGYLLIGLSGFAIFLFCWLSYASLTCAARAAKAASDELPGSTGNINGAMSPGAG